VTPALLWISTALAACPDAHTDPPACAAGHTRGQTDDQPLEWGMAAEGTQPWWGRLSCRDGRIPVVRRHGGVHRLEESSTSPPSGLPALGRPELVDAWEVGCPEGRAVLYTNAYRCGEICVPVAYTLLPGAAVTQLEAAQLSARSGKVEEALAALRSATSAAPAHERTWIVRGGMAEELGRFDEALLAWEGAMSRFPGPLTEGHRAEALARLGRKEEASVLAASLLAEAPDGPARARLLCVQSLVSPDPAKGRTLAKQSCAEGYRRCCAE
jgi:tetratricopeptide (TPR) repeat protein